MLGIRTEWLPRRADGVVALSCGPHGRRVVRTEWLPCRAYRLRGRRVGRKDRVVAASCGQRGHHVERTGPVVEVLGVRTEWSPRCTDSVVAVLSVPTAWSTCCA